MGALADCCAAARSAFDGVCTPAERADEDVWAVGPSEVTQPETTLTKVAARTIFHILVAPKTAPTCNTAWLAAGKPRASVWPGGEFPARCQCRPIREKRRQGGCLGEIPVHGARPLSICDAQDQHELPPAPIVRASPVEWRDRCRPRHPKLRPPDGFRLGRRKRCRGRNLRKGVRSRSTSGMLRGVGFCRGP
jgi:hypothetical protein